MTRTSSTSALPVRIVEVGPRDGLQNEPGFVPTETKVELIERLGNSGLNCIEATAFVSPKWVPQMADAAKVLQGIKRMPGVTYPVLTPNLQGLESALAAGATEVAVFAAASEAFSQKNINCSIAESLHRFEPVFARALAARVKVRGYVSCVLGCPYQGDVLPDAVATVAAELHAMGCHEVSLGDTIGTGTPRSTQRLVEAVTRRVPAPQLAGHFHDTFGMAIANVHAAWRSGITVFDASVGGLGGCPYARGASGNVATEDVVWLFRQMDIDCGIDLDTLVETARWISSSLDRKVSSKVATALLARSQSD